MDEGELVGGVLFDAANPAEAASVLARVLVSGERSARRIRQLGFEPALVDGLRRGLPSDPQTIELACAKGGAWVLGRRSAARQDSWELVASLPAGESLPDGLRRTTGETLILVATEAEQRLRFSAPFVDVDGMRFLAEAIAAATARGVVVEVFEPPRSTGWPDALQVLRRAVAGSGNPERLTILPAAGQDAPWSHLKVMVADDRVAYIGSANITGAGLAGRNLELGVLVRGPGVAVIDRVLETYLST